MDSKSENLHFRFAPHILEDLGVNLYTSVSKALVEFIANAYDADATQVSIQWDVDSISDAVSELQAKHKRDKKRNAANREDAPLKPLQEQTLPHQYTITIEDNGQGMTRNDLQEKYLVIGRRRRKGIENSARSAKGRIIMGRKGLGKLAGFGIAHVLEVTSKVASESHATRIKLDINTLLQTSSTSSNQADVSIPVERVDGGANLLHGTRIVLKGLVLNAVKGDLTQELLDTLSRNFYGIRPEEFRILVNEETVQTDAVEFAYAYPEIDDLPIGDLAEGTIKVDDDVSYSIRYRIRFRPAKKYLPAKSRGVRVYAHHRLASNPDLLDVKSSANGFLYTSYLDGVVVADIIDEQPTDYISTDRQSLRWDTPILQPLRNFITEKMTEALDAYADRVSTTISKKIYDDEFTKRIISEGRLPKHREKIVWAVAKSLAGKDGGDVGGSFYQNTLPMVVKGVGHGEILAAIEKLASQAEIDLRDVIRQITELTKTEFDDFIGIISGRLKGIEMLRNLTENVDFREARNEKELHELLKKNPWLIDPTFFEFLSSNETEGSLQKRLAQHLQVGDHCDPSYDVHSAGESEPYGSNKRPDLTFLLSNNSLARLVIVELKAPNTPLHIGHLAQLERYMRKAEEFAEKALSRKVNVEGILIGSLNVSDRNDKVADLYDRIKQERNKSRWKVVDLMQLLGTADAAHREMLQAYTAASQR